METLILAYLNHDNFMACLCLCTISLAFIHEHAVNYSSHSSLYACEMCKEIMISVIHCEPFSAYSNNNFQLLPKEISIYNTGMTAINTSVLKTYSLKTL